MLHFSPVVTGLSFLRLPMTLAFMSARTPKLVQRYGFECFMVAGPLVIALGMLYLSFLHSNSSYWLGILPAALLLSVGIGMTMMPTIAATTAGVPANETGISSGLISTSQQKGGALGLSILCDIAASVRASSMNLGGLEASIHGYHVAFLTAAGFMLMAAVVALLVIKTPKH